jgi:hypothetical protein
MGFPGDPSYEKNSRRYLACEQEVMRESLAQMQSDKESSLVLDTTGSVIYTGADILQSLRAETRVIYFEASENHTASLFRSYTGHRPKPVIWGELYAPIAGETSQQTLERCYPALLSFRAHRYKEIAHITIPFELIQNHWANVGAFVLERAKHP